ncbi:MAG TPA: hypothetical protein PKL92_03880, partial [Aquaticitalea sp.]|nr:hypothetical protein [Aquaticitalea sp.]
MKHLYILCFLTLHIQLFGQSALRTLESSDAQTDIIFGTFPLIDIGNYQDQAITVHNFYQAYNAIEKNDRLQRLNEIGTLKEQEKESYFTNLVPLAILNTEYETLKPMALLDGSITSTDGTTYSRTTSAPIFDKHALFLASPLRTGHKGLNTVFVLPQENVFNTTGKNISSIAIDFDNNQGYTTIQTGQHYDVHYLTEGEKKLKTRIIFSDGSQKVSESVLKISYSNEDLNSLHYRAVTQFTSTNVPAADLSAYGEANNYKGIGEYDIYLSPDNVLDKPIILVDGFDFGDTRNIQSIYELLNFDDNGTPSNLADLVRAEGFDVIILNFPVYTRPEDNALIDGGVDYIERNAMLLVELIQIINGQKEGDEPNVIIGPSMGGLISRYALNYMENQSLTHDTRLWISFDSPHLGANVPIGFQHLFNYLAFGLQLGGLAGDQSVEALQ